MRLDARLFQNTTHCTIFSPSHIISFLTCLPPLSSNFLVNSADRVIRVFNIDQIMDVDDDDDIEALQRLQDLVNRTQWKKCTFSGDGEFIVAGSHRQHALYIWDKATGSLVKMLTGQKGETLLDIAVSCKAHPVAILHIGLSGEKDFCRFCDPQLEKNLYTICGRLQYHFFLLSLSSCPSPICLSLSISLPAYFSSPPLFSFSLSLSPLPLSQYSGTQFVQSFSPYPMVW